MICLFVLFSMNHPLKNIAVETPNEDIADKLGLIYLSLFHHDIPSVIDDKNLVIR